jgi:protein involved in polysaccharide export with SLBB domain
MKPAFHAFSLICILSLLVGCKSTRPTTEPVNRELPAVTFTNQVSPELLEPKDELFTLGPGDAVDIEILGEPESRAGASVGPDGRIYYHLLPGVDVWGLTLAQSEERLEQELIKYFATTPEVHVNLRAVGSRYVWLLGRVNRPGLYPLTGPMTLLEALALAGGAATSESTATTEELASLHHSFVMRNGQLLPVDFHRLLQEGDTSQNIYLEPDDFVYVPSTLGQEIYVLGEVRNPRAVPYTEDASLLKAIASAGDVIEYQPTGFSGYQGAYLSQVAIVRGSLSEPEMLVVDYKAIRLGQAPDIRLEPRDIVYVPRNPWNLLRDYLDMIVNTFVRTTAANEGARFSGGEGRIGQSTPVY